MTNEQNANKRELATIPYAAHEAEMERAHRIQRILAAGLCASVGMLALLFWLTIVAR